MKAPLAKIHNARIGAPQQASSRSRSLGTAVTCAHRSWRIKVFVLLDDRAGPAVRGRRTQHRKRAGGRCECTGTAPPGYRSPSRRLPVSADHRGGGMGRARRRGQWPGRRRRLLSSVHGRRGKRPPGGEAGPRSTAPDTGTCPQLLRATPRSSRAAPGRKPPGQTESRADRRFAEALRRAQVRCILESGWSDGGVFVGER